MVGGEAVEVGEGEGRGGMGRERLGGGFDGRGVGGMGGVVGGRRFSG